MNLALRRPADALNLHKLFIDVLDPQTGETALVLVDMPEALDDTLEWAARRAMAERWHAALVELGAVKGFTVLPLVRYVATGAHSAQLPATGEQQVWHHDIVYTRQRSISVSQLIFVDDAGIEETIIRDGHYVERLEIGM